MADVMGSIKRKLIMTFDTELGRQVSLSVDAPRDGLKESEIKTSMEAIINADIFAPYGSKLTSCASAKVVKTDEDKYDLEA